MKNFRVIIIFKKKTQVISETVILSIIIYRINVVILNKFAMYRINLPLIFSRPGEGSVKMGLSLRSKDLSLWTPL